MWCYRLSIYGFHFKAVERSLSTFLWRGYWVWQDREPLAESTGSHILGLGGEPALWNAWLPGAWTTSELSWDWRTEWLLAWHPRCQIYHPRHWVTVGVWEGAPLRGLRVPRGPWRQGWGLAGNPPHSWPASCWLRSCINLQWGEHWLVGMKIDLYLWAQPRGRVRCHQYPTEMDGSGRGLWRSWPTFIHSAIEWTFTEHPLVPRIISQMWRFERHQTWACPIETSH